MSELEYWIAFNMLPDIGPVLARRLLSHFGNPINVFQASTSELKHVQDIGESRIKSITGFNQWDIVHNEIENAKKKGIKIVTFNNSKYPYMLRNLPDAPLLLYVKGEIRDDDRYAVAIVGSRQATGYGLRVAETISSALTSYGLTIVSGMARGIDAASHKGALRSGGRTLAVMGSGIDVPYPMENKGLIETVALKGAVISEFPLGTAPNRENFPKRNRIISGLSLGVLVVEATVDSGSLITVQYALEQGKEVFALPGNVTSKNSKGTNKLIKNGAKLVENAEEIIEELRPQIKGILKEQRLNSGRDVPEMSEEEKTIYRFLDTEPKHIDLIIRGTNMPGSKALSLLLSLELKGIVRQVEGKRFCIN
jgi:DNA processing protein